MDIWLGETLFMKEMTGKDVWNDASKHVYWNKTGTVERDLFSGVGYAYLLEYLIGQTQD